MVFHRFSLILALYALALTSLLLGVQAIHVNIDMERSSKVKKSKSVIKELDMPQDQDRSKKIMFWRPQKVGSSTIVNILNTYGLRHNLTISPKGVKNSLCHFIDKCAKELNLDLEASTETTSKLKKIKLRAIDSSDLSRHADISVMHHLCDVSGHTTQAALPCAFRSHKSAKRTPIKQITVVREPLSRALSVYYFWGELFKLKEISRSSDKKKFRASKGIGQAAWNQSITSGRFVYHGDETTPPPLHIARSFAADFSRVYTAGMPGPSYMWSAFSNSVKDASSRFLPISIPSHPDNPQVLPMVLERLDESLVLMSDYLGWSLADAVFVKPRKALSSHPKASTWDESAITELSRKLHESGEMKYYENANKALDTLVQLFNKRHQSQSDVGGVTPFESRTEMFKAMKTRVAEICHLESTTVDMYRSFLSQQAGTEKCDVKNKLRDVDSVYIEQGHCFHVHPKTRMVFLSIDLCGSCEAQAMEYAVERGISKTVADAPRYEDLRSKLDHSVLLKHFNNCP